MLLLPEEFAQLLVDLLKQSRSPWIQDSIYVEAVTRLLGLEKLEEEEGGEDAEELPSAPE